MDPNQLASVFKNDIFACACPDPESFVNGGPTLTFFFVDKGREDPNTTIIGPSSAGQLNAIVVVVVGYNFRRIRRTS